MESLSMQWKLFTLDSNSGYTVVELLVAAGMGLGILAMTSSLIVSNRGLFQLDMARTRLNQNLRGSLDVISMNVREAGENLSAAFPAVELIDGGGAPDELILRRNLLDEVLNICIDIGAGSSDDIYFAIPGTVAGCSYADTAQNYTAWENHRDDEGGTVAGYIFDLGSQTGEFFQYVGEADTGTQRIINVGGSWSANYTAGSAAAYIIEEWRFSVNDNGIDEPMLQLVENEDALNPQNVMYAITDFQVDILLDDGTTVTSFAPGDDWSRIRAINVSITGEENNRGTIISKTVTGRYFPRNVLSN